MPSQVNSIFKILFLLIYLSIYQLGNKQTHHWIAWAVKGHNVYFHLWQDTANLPSLWRRRRPSPSQNSKCSQSHQQKLEIHAHRWLYTKNKQLIRTGQSMMAVKQTNNLDSVLCNSQSYHWKVLNQKWKYTFLILTCIFVAFKINDGHSLEAGGARGAIWVDQSQISIRIPAGK